MKLKINILLILEKQEQKRYLCLISQQKTSKSGLIRLSIYKFEFIVTQNSIQLKYSNPVPQLRN